MPQQAEPTTKQRILDVSIDLIAKYGFKEVTMRQIAKEVGIKASSLYKHYESKEDILNSIFALFSEKLAQTDVQMPEIESPSQYFELAFERFKQVMWEPGVLKIAKIITMEQHYSRSVRDSFAKVLIEYPAQTTKHVFDLLAEKGHIRDMDTRVLAEEYNAYIVYLYFEQNLLHDSPSLEVIDKKMKQHNDFFARYILNKENKS